MINITLDNERLYICEESEKDKFRLADSKSFLALGLGLHLYIGTYTRKEFVNLSGLTGNIDYAVPQDYFERNIHRYTRGEWSIWNYRNSSDYFGEVVWNSEIEKKLKARIYKKLIAQLNHH